MSKYIVVRIGCIECGVSSGIVGVFYSKIEADKIAKVANKKYDWKDGGQNIFEVFKMPKIGEINEGYPLLKENK